LEQCGIDLVYVNAPLVMDNTHDNDHDIHHASRHHHHRVYMDGDAPFHKPESHDDHDDVDGRPRTWWQTTRALSRARRRLQQPDPDSEPEEELVDEKDNIEADDNNENSRVHDSRSNEEQQQQEQHQKQEQQHYVGLDASLLLLQQIWKTSSYPTSLGILGVGQGAQMGALLSLMLHSNMQHESTLDEPDARVPLSNHSNVVIPPPRFAIWINASTASASSLWSDERERLIDEMDCLHFVARNQSNSNTESSSYRLYQQFGGQVIVQEDDDDDAAADKDVVASQTSSSTSHNMKRKHNKRRCDWWTMAVHVNQMGRFLLEQKRALQKQLVDYASLQQHQHQQQQHESLLALPPPTSDAKHTSSSNSSSNDNDDDDCDVYQNDCRVLVLQHALLQAQHEASAVIAREIANNPPAALMAIIQPTSVAVGANAPGARLHRPADSGGAPCPSEFLLQRNKRQSNHYDPNNKSAASASASREHPSQRPEVDRGLVCNDDDVHMEGS
jgi:Serine hydrolase (FSH1)